MSHAALLSQYNFIGNVGEILSSCNKFLIHNRSHTPLAILLYSASALDLATTPYFLLRHITRFPPTNVKYSIVERLSSIEPAQSASV